MPRDTDSRQPAYNGLTLQSGHQMKRTLKGMAAAGEDLLQRALEANRRLRRAEQSGAPVEEVERHRLLADLLYRQVTEHQLIQEGLLPHLVH